MRTGFIGAGKVGTSLGKYLAENGAEVTGYYSRDTEHADEAARFTGSTVYDSAEDITISSDVLFLTVPDSAINDVYRELDGVDIEGKYICHTSGSLTAAEAFPGAEARGAHIYSVHPLFAVSDKYSAYRELPDVFFAIEGSATGLDTIREYLATTGLKLNNIRPKGKVMYHAGAVIASNLAIALMEDAASLLSEAGFTPDDARDALSTLAIGNLDHYFCGGPEESLTGPIERGDAETIRKHLGVIRSGRIRKEYIALSERLLGIAHNKHEDRSYEEVRKVLEDYEK